MNGGVVRDVELTQREIVGQLHAGVEQSQLGRRNRGPHRRRNLDTRLDFCDGVGVLGLDRYGFAGQCPDDEATILHRMHLF